MNPVKAKFLRFTALIVWIDFLAGCSSSNNGAADSGVEDSGSSSKESGSNSDGSESEATSKNDASPEGAADHMADTGATDTTEGGGPAALYGTWEDIVNNGTGIFDYTFNADGAYQFTTRGITSSTSAIEIVQQGTFAATDNTIIYTPQEESCPGPVAVYLVTYSIVNSGGIEYIAGTASNGPFTYEKVGGPTMLGSGFTTTVGCLANGTFTPQPVGPVTNN